jgi:uncharacterized protein YndB with AHSA1/START domain
MSLLAEPEQELVIERVFAAPRELVFKAWTTPDMARNWWGPPWHPVGELEMDVRVGGRWRNCLVGRDNGEELWQSGVFREVDPPRRLAFTFKWEATGERGLETLVTITFEEDGGKTLMTFRQTPFQSIAERDGHRLGWNGSFDRLMAALAQI